MLIYNKLHRKYVRATSFQMKHRSIQKKILFLNASMFYLKTEKKLFIKKRTKKEMSINNFFFVLKQFHFFFCIPHQHVLIQNMNNLLTVINNTNLHYFFGITNSYLYHFKQQFNFNFFKSLYKSYYKIKNLNRKLFKKKHKKRRFFMVRKKTKKMNYLYSLKKKRIKIKLLYSKWVHCL